MEMMLISVKWSTLLDHPKSSGNDAFHRMSLLLLTLLSNCDHSSSFMLIDVTLSVVRLYLQLFYIMQSVVLTFIYVVCEQCFHLSGISVIAIENFVAAELQFVNICFRFDSVSIICCCWELVNK